MKTLAYSSTLNNQEMSNFWLSLYELASIKAIKDLINGLSDKEGEILIENFWQMQKTNAEKEGLLSLIKNSSDLNKTAFKLFKEGHREIENALPGFTDSLAKHF